MRRLSKKRFINLCPFAWQTTVPGDVSAFEQESNEPDFSVRRRVVEFTGIKFPVNQWLGAEIFDDGRPLFE